MKKQQFTNQQLFILIWPLVIEQGLAILVGMADTVMVSSAGEAAISGVSLVDMINNLVFTIFAGLATGGAVVTNQAIGADDNDRVKRSVGQLVNLAALIGFGVMLFCLALRRPMLRLFFGNAICIYGLKMGVAGVAIPTAVSRIFGAVAILFLAGRINGPARITLKSVLSFDSLMAGKILTSSM